VLLDCAPSLDSCAAEVEAVLAFVSRTGNEQAAEMFRPYQSRTIYAPEASIDIDSNFQLFGAVVARRLHLDSNSQIHYDESLLRSSSSGRSDYEAIYWRELSYSVR
jgi:hypothetical protein